VAKVAPTRAEGGGKRGRGATCRSFKPSALRAGTPARNSGAPLRAPDTPARSPDSAAHAPDAPKHAPAAEKHPPVAHEVAPVAHKLSPVAKKDSPVATKAPPVAKTVPPVANEALPAANEVSPVAKKLLPAAGKPAPDEKEPREDGSDLNFGRTALLRYCYEKYADRSQQHPCRYCCANASPSIPRASPFSPGKGPSNSRWLVCGRRSRALRPTVIARRGGHACHGNCAHDAVGGDRCLRPRRARRTDRVLSLWAAASAG
jgi:hypothetical protein